MTEAQYVPLTHPKVGLEGVLRLSHLEPADGSRLRFDNGSKIVAERITQHATFPMPTYNLGPHIRLELQRFEANAFSVRPYQGKMLPGVDVTIYSIRNSPTD